MLQTHRCSQPREGNEADESEQAWTECARATSTPVLLSVE